MDIFSQCTFKKIESPLLKILKVRVQFFLELPISWEVKIFEHTNNSELKCFSSIYGDSNAF